MPTAQELLRALATQGPAAADALDNIPHLEATITGLETTRDQLTADLAEARRQLEERPMPADGPVLLNGAPTLDSFRKPGGTWDDALDAALADILDARATRTTTPPLLWPVGRVDLARGGRVWFDGLKHIQPFGHGNQQRAAESIPCDVRFTGKGPLWRFTAPTVFDIGFEGIGWQGNAEADFIEASRTVVWTSVFGSAGFNLWRHVLGTPTQQFLTTACTFHGWWNTNNCYAQPYTVGGSDATFMWDRHIIDVGGPATASKFPKTDWLMHLAHQSKGTVQGVYMTCQGDVNGLKVSNSTTGGRMVVRDIEIEGRNTRQPCTGTLLQVDSGVVIFENPSILFGLKDKSREAGAPVVVNGGDVELLRPTYDRAAGRAENDPWLYQSGGVVNIERAKLTESGGGWQTRQLPVKRAGGVLTHDASVVEV